MINDVRAALADGHAGKLSPHRRLHEFTNLLGEKDPRAAFALLKAWGYLPLLHAELPWKNALPTGVEPRLAALVLALGAKKGRAFVDAFPHPHHLRTLLHDSLSLAFSDKSPRTAPEPLTAKAVSRFLPELPAGALKPCFLTGADLIAAGLKPGPAFHALLDEAARLQRAGKLKTRATAVAWLKKK